MIDSAHLLEQADALLAARQDGSSARLTDRRRSISATYYALFHTALAAAADQSVGHAARGSGLYSLAYRSIDHKVMKGLCDTVQKQTPPNTYKRYTPTTGWGMEICSFAEAFITLNEQRMLADYDPSYTVTVSECLSYITVARTAIGKFDTADAELKRAFLTLLLFPPR